MHRDAELEGLRADVAAKTADAQLLADLQSQLAARETEIARLQAELSSLVRPCFKNDVYYCSNINKVHIIYF